MFRTTIVANRLWLLPLLGATLLSITALAVAQNTEGTQGEAAPSPVTTPAPVATATGTSPAVSAASSSRTTSRRTATPASTAVVAEDLPKEDDATSTKTTATSPSSSASSTSSTTEKAPLSPIALPTGGDKSGVTTKTLSIPKGAGSIEGMGESFSAQLSTGIATFSVPFALPKARGAAQPSLGLSYSSGSGQGLAGQGWDVGVPFIARQTDRGVPNYGESSGFQANQDRFVFNGGQELVPICTVEAGLAGAGASCKGALSGEAMPAWSAGWQYFRPRVEGSFLRFFWSQNHRTWRVQDKNGVTLELGVPLNDANYLTAIERNPDSIGLEREEIYRWHLVRQFDAQGSSNAATAAVARNVVDYRYVQEGGIAVLTDIYDTPAAVGTPGFEGHAHHTRLRYEPRTDPTVSYRSGWRMEQRLRLVGVDVTSKTFNGGAERRMVRRYHLSYSSAYHQSLLESVQVEGRCGSSEDSEASEGSSGTLASTSCPRLPAMGFSYQHVSPLKVDGTPGARDLSGYEGFDERLLKATGSPKHSLDEELSDLFDVNSDGLPDVLVTAPGLYNAGHAVFFNGAAGAKGFSGVTPMTVAGVNGADANTITLRNLNVSPLDLDGDGRVNFLHMPMTQTYAVYDAVRGAGGWRWQGRAVTTATRQNPKIDFGKDTLEIQVMDVNFDGLVDVVYGSGTEVQTFFSLGRYPGGDGQFGQGEFSGAITSKLSNDPVKTCVPWAGLPIRFSDKETKTADMNGDGITDIVKLQRGQIRYWPGRGNGFWGTGKRNDCGAGTFGSNRHEEMADSPQFSDIEGDSLRLDDVNGDGLSDLVQIRYNAVDVWLNVDGKGWTGRHIIENSPYSPSYAQRVRLTDINGSGTPDILWGNSENYQYMDLTGGNKPGILVGVTNGLGKSTTLEYSTSTEEMLKAESQTACPETGLPATADPWGYAWCSKMPTVAHVVKRVTETDNLVAAGQGPSSIVTEYEYRDPVYEGRQREFRGFERARARRLGDANSPTDVSESWFLLGQCQDLTQDGTDDCSNPERWRDNPMEALKGLPIATEKKDLSGRTLSTDVTEYELRKLYTGLDGRAVRQAVAVATHSYVYDTSAAFVPAGVESFIVASQKDSSSATPSPLVTKSVPLRSGQFARIEGQSEVDFFGNQTTAKKLGCTAGCSDPDAGLTIASDETLTQVTVPGRPKLDATGWLFRTVESYTTGSQHGDQKYGYQRTTYDSAGNPEQVFGNLSGSVSLTRDHAPDAYEEGEFIAAETEYDAYGNPTRVKGPDGRCSDIGYDDTYNQLPTSESVYKGADCTGNPMSMGSAYDRGLGLVTTAVDLNDQITRVVYDGFGRTIALHKPGVKSPDPSPTASVKIEYFLPPSLGTNVSAIHTMTEDGASADGSNYLESWAFVDGFGRTRTTLTEADKSAGDGGDWVVSGLVTHDAKGAVQRKHVEYFWDGTPATFPIAATPSTPYGSQRYDAFGRAIQTFDIDGTMTLKTVYHALSTDLWDAEDSSPGPHAGTYASARKDGHGRASRATERVHSGGQIQSRHVITEYNPAGQAEVIRRRKGSTGADDVARWMMYDSLGRMVLNVDAHTTVGFVGPPSAASIYAPPESLQTWRYQYNLAGDLVATQDARKCGVNFAYDALGRLLGEDYVPCEPHHQPYSETNAGGTSGWEVAYHYDAAPAGPSPFTASYTTGRLIAVRDRASETWTNVDGHGNVTVTARRIAKPADVDIAGRELVPDVILDRYTDQWFAKYAAYDAADRVVAETVGGVNGAAPTEFSGTVAEEGGKAEYHRQLIRTTYSARGVVATVGGSYGSLVGGITRRADGLVESLAYGDAARTTTATAYDDRRRPRQIMTYRAGNSLWSLFGVGGAGKSGVTYSPLLAADEYTKSLQVLLEDTELTYDSVGNPTEIRDWRESAEWPNGAKPVTKKLDYDDLYRVARVDYQYSIASGVDPWTSPFEKENVESDSDRDKRRAKPVPQLAFTNRPLTQRYEYDWLGNLSKSDDDAHGFWDRSLGDQQHGNSEKRYQLTGASNAAQASGSGFAGTVVTRYDSTGNMTRLGVVRPTISGKCLPGGSGCTQEYAYEWDEVGRLVRARRWDSTANSVNVTVEPPTSPPAIDLRHRYDASDNRVLKRVYAANAADQRHSLYVFGSFEVRRTIFASNAYTVDAQSAVPYAMANGVRLARLHYGYKGEPQVSGLGTSDAGFTGAGPALHVLFELGDHLGSTSTVIDKATGELVEKSSYLAYGAKESDYRTARWQGFREDYGFTGKEEDVEVGLVYFGKRFLSPQLGRWVSPDPLAVHAPGEADFNLYAYVSGAVLKSVDPVGLCDAAGSGGSCATSNGSSEGAPSVEPNKAVEAERAELTDVKRLAQLADAAYGVDRKLPDGAMRLTENDLSRMGIDPSLMRDDKSGFSASLFYDAPKQHYVLAFEGTEKTSGKDWKTNGGQGLGIRMEQYQRAMGLAAKVRDTVGEGGLSLTLTGHSLGGGLAAAASRYTGLNATTFNAAGLNANTSVQAVIEGPNQWKLGEIVNYSVQGDVLTAIQTTTVMADAEGAQRELPPAKPSAPVGVKLHEMATVISAIDKRLSTLAREKQ